METQPFQGPLFQTRDLSITGIWNLLQRAQADLTFFQDLAFFYGSSEWMAAKTVIDLGTGNGYYLSRLASHFPEKKYLGLDKSSDLIQTAEQGFSREGIHFICCDLFDAQGTYEFATMRLLLQHLSDLDAVLLKAARLIKPGGSALIIDSCDPLRFFYPPMPEFVRFFAAYTKAQETKGLDRSAVGQVMKKVEVHPHWEFSAHHRLIVPSTIPGNMDLFRQIYGLVIDVIERTSNVSCSYDKVRAELRRWCGLERAYTQVGVEAVQLKRKND
jgi:SAM-dependent methyltransferase